MPNFELESQVEPIEHDEKEVDILNLLRRWSKQLASLELPDRRLVLHFLNEKFGA